MVSGVNFHVGKACSIVSVPLVDSIVIVIKQGGEGAFVIGVS